MREMTPPTQTAFPERELSLVLSETEPGVGPTTEVKRQHSDLSLGRNTPDEQHIKSTIEKIPHALSGSRQTLWHKKASIASNDPLDIFVVRVEL